MSEVISSIRSLRAGSQVLLPFGILCVSAIRMMFMKIIVAVCTLVCIVDWAKVDVVFSVYCVQSAFL